MSNRTHVCFECRTTERVPVSRIIRICRRCRKHAEHVFYKFKIPRRNDDAGWQELQSKARTLVLTTVGRLEKMCEVTKAVRLRGAHSPPPDRSPR